MKTVKFILLGLIILVLLALAAGAYQYYRTHRLIPMSPNSGNSADVKVVAGTVVSASASSITITKQDGSTATFSANDATKVESIVAAGEVGKGLSEMQPKTMVLVLPAAQNSSVAEKVSVTPPVPAPTSSAAGTPVVVLGTVQAIKSNQFLLDSVSGESVLVTKSASVHILTKVFAGQTGKADIATGDTVLISGVTASSGVTAQTIEIVLNN